MPTVILTRPSALAPKNAAYLEALGYCVVLLPVMQILLTGYVPIKTSEQAVLATSAQAFIAPLAKDFLRLPCFVIGSQTGKAASIAGFTKVFIAPSSNAEALLGLLDQKMPNIKHVAYFTSKIRKPVLEQRLITKGLRVSVSEVYQSQAVERWPDDAVQALKDALMGTHSQQHRLACLHYSRRSAALFLSLCAHHDLGDALLERVRTQMRHICLSQDVAIPLQDCQASHVFIAKTTQDADMIATLQAVLSKAD